MVSTRIAADLAGAVDAAHHDHDAANGTAGALEDYVLQLRGGAESSEGDAPAAFVVIVKNMRTLQTEGRFEELLRECEALPRDVIFVKETWQSGAEKIIKLEMGHYWFGPEVQKRSMQSVSFSRKSLLFKSL